MANQGKTPPLSNIDDYTAQHELDAVCFPNYLLGRCLAIEHVLKDVMEALPPKKRQEITEKLQASADGALLGLREDEALDFPDPKRNLTNAGFAHALMVMGFSGQDFPPSGDEA